MEYPQDTDRTTLSGGETISEEMIGIDGAINASLEFPERSDQARR